jgi:hypothetical protein
MIATGGDKEFIPIAVTGHKVLRGDDTYLIFDVGFPKNAITGDRLATVRCENLTRQDAMVVLVRLARVPHKEAHALLDMATEAARES